MAFTLPLSPPPRAAPAPRPKPATIDAETMTPARWRYVSGLSAAWFLADYAYTMRHWLDETIARRERLFADPAFNGHPKRGPALGTQERDILERKRIGHELDGLLDECARTWAGMDDATRAYVAGLWGVDPALDKAGMRAWIVMQLKTGGSRNREALECPW